MVIFIVALLVVAPFIAAYFLFIKGVDRYEPEPTWLLAVCFFWGFLGATCFGIVGNGVGAWGLGVALDLGQGDPTLEAASAVIVAPLVEESTKGIFLLAVLAASACWLKCIDGPLDGAIYGGMIGLGFTWLEDALYISDAGAQDGAVGFTVLLFLRTILAGFGHASFTAMTGIGIGIAATTRNVPLKILAPIGGWVLAVGLHAIHNFLPAFLGDAGAALMFLGFWAFDLLFFAAVGALVLRDRSIIVRSLRDEVGRTLQPREYEHTTTLRMLIPLWNFTSLSKLPCGYRAARRKQRALIDLAFLKHHKERGATDLAAREASLRAQIDAATAAGVFVGG